MGIPTTSEAPPTVSGYTTIQPLTKEDIASSSIPAPANQTPSREPTSTPSLPPAALDLAAKLFDLARAGDLPTLSQYLSAGIPANLTNSAGDTLLMLAAYNGHAQLVALLLDRGADPNAINDRGQSPIAGAVFKGYDEVVRVLFGRGGDVRMGRPTAVDTARMFRRGEVLELFGVREEDEPPLPGAVPRPAQMAPGGDGAAADGDA